MSRVEATRSEATHIFAEQKWTGSTPDVSIFLAWADNLRDLVDAGLIRTNQRVAVSDNAFRINTTLTMASEDIDIAALAAQKRAGTFVEPTPVPTLKGKGKSAAAAIIDRSDETPDFN